MHANTPAAPAVFTFGTHPVRTITIDGAPWFVAADVCAALELPNTTRALDRLDDDEKALNSIQGISRGNDQANIVNESGLYSLILGSRKPEAKKFKKWVTSEVLPAIRRTGQYRHESATIEAPALPMQLRRFLASFDDQGRMVMTELALGAMVLDLDSPDFWRNFAGQLSPAQSADGLEALAAKAGKLIRGRA